MSSPQRLIGSTVGKYKIVEMLGRGGMAEVYKAYQELLDRYVAIKLMHAFLADEEDFLSRFQREARAMAALSHPNIVSVYDFDVQNGIYYIVMEYVSGGTLKQSLEGLASVGERLPLSHTVQIVLEIADALAYAHSRGMVHRDIKPANIMLNEDGRAVLTDFGIAKILSGPSFTATGAMIGTPAYMSPEQGLGQPGDERSDLYALGVLFFQMATGRLPYDADTPLAVILKHVNEPIPEPTRFDVTLPEAIHKVILKAMAKNPEERYQTANALANDLRAAVRVSDMETGVVIPSDLLKDKPTPPPMRTVPSATPSGIAATILPSASATPAGAELTRVGSANLIDQTDIASPPAPPKKRSRVPLVIGGVVLLFLIAAVAVGGIVLASRGKGEETPTSQPVVVAATDTPEATEAVATAAESEEATPQSTVDIGATAAAVVAQALTAAPTDTPLPTPTIAPTFTPTPNLTATFIASCEVAVDVVKVYTYQNENVKAAPVGSNFPVSWVLHNSGDCPIAADNSWEYVEGETFEQDAPIALTDILEPGDEVTLKSTFAAPDQPGDYESTWQLVDADGNPLGSPFTFEITIYIPATPTPVLPTLTPTPEVSATPTAAAEALDFNYSVSNCEYTGIEWRCQMTINVYGGTPPYTVFVFDEDQPAEYRGTGPFTHFIHARRCSPWNHEIRAQDEGGGNVSQGTYLVPDNYFPGGCTLP
ncbi:MAG: protein kinase [Candidatus Promineifilaceae bacterium]